MTSVCLRMVVLAGLLAPSFRPLQAQDGDHLAAQGATPSSSFTLNLSTKKAELHVGEAVWIEIVQTNVSDHSVSCDYAGGNAVNLIYDYHVFKEDGSPAEEVVRSKPVPPPFSYKQCGINPGESRTDTIHLNNVYKFDKPGQYTVWVSRVDPDTEDESGEPVVVKSNTITITITE
jgi:hypothetical protein